MDVDAGPVVAGYGVSANAFGIGAARRNGRFDRAFPIEAEMLATVWELPGGALAVPRLLSNLSDAPFLGEASVLWLLSVQPEKGFPIKTGGAMPLFAWLLTIGALVLGILVVLESIWRYRTAVQEPEREYPWPGLQTALWICLPAGALAAQWTAHRWAGLVLLLLALLLPRGKKHPREQGNRPEDIPGGRKAES
jgi:hypothetical protein